MISNLSSQNTLSKCYHLFLVLFSLVRSLIWLALNSFHEQTFRKRWDQWLRKKNIWSREYWIVTPTTIREIQPNRFFSSFFIGVKNSRPVAIYLWNYCANAKAKVTLADSFVIGSHKKQVADKHLVYATRIRNVFCAVKALMRLMAMILSLQGSSYWCQSIFFHHLKCGFECFSFLMANSFKIWRRL